MESLFQVKSNSGCLACKTISENSGFVNSACTPSERHFVRNLIAMHVRIEVSLLSAAQSAVEIQSKLTTTI